MATHILVTYNHRTDETTTDFFNNVEDARTSAARLAGEIIDLNQGAHSAPSEVDFMNKPAKRVLTVIDKRGMSWITYRVNDNVRHCRSCHCNQSAFA